MSILDVNTIEQESESVAILYKPIYLKDMTDIDPFYRCNIEKDDRYITIQDMLDISDVFDNHRLTSKMSLIKGIKDKLDLSLVEAKAVVDWFIKHCCTYIKLNVNCNDTEYEYRETFLSGECCGVKIYDMKQESQMYAREKTEDYRRAQETGKELYIPGMTVIQKKTLKNIN